MKNVGNSIYGRSQGVPKISRHPCIGRMGALRGHLCDSTAFLSFMITGLGLGLALTRSGLGLKRAGLEPIPVRNWERVR